MNRNVIVSASLLLASITFLSSADALFDKTRFVLHLGAAYYAFHRWDLKPYQQGAFAQGAPGRTGNFVKAGLALAFAAHEVVVAKNIAETSKSPLLQKLSGSLTVLSGKMSSLGNDLKAGKFNANDLQALNTSTEQFKTQAAAAGQTIKDVTVPVPGL